ncbi:glutamate--cysteine ligase [Halorubrum sp. JWXQ-INN 858]|uniref:glutamate-cysteine ligase family protein n=1 Tax=Halorubrum sp. JWXQ-INN 858 TaxID=2690782 RepID=UPI00135CA769|nr:glutamate-cysteine ligase family protein [Halorubrum sp. JWXQ-INN 858]MWV65442.1 glutamate--cysteine ligase [Halorubrum sp. JWXQ-INN 858]
MCEIKTGVELELWVIDRSGRLCDGREIAEAHERIKPEFIGPLVEIQTEPHENELELRRDLRRTLQTAMRAASAEGKQLVPLGTPLTASDASAHSERGRLLETIYGDGLKSAKNCAGTHVHFEKGDVIDQLNLLTALDPALALLSTSPYYSGKNGNDSSRAQAYRKLCGPEFRGFCDLWSYADSLEEWTERVDHMYEVFKRLSSERGVSPETVEEFFDPEDTVLNPVRLRECQPTVEWRAPDAALPSQIVQIAVDVGQLVSQTGDKPIEFGSPGVRSDRIRLPEFSELQELSHQAIRSGLGTVEVREYLRTMGFDLSKYQPLSPQLNGPPTLDESEARMLRLEQAQRLRTDVEGLTGDSTISAPTTLSI